MPDRVYDSRAIANYLIRKAHPQGLDALQVMKLAYIAHGFTLAVEDRPLIEDDVEAWKYGPVVRRIYVSIPSGSAPITQPIANVAAHLQDGEHEIVDEVFRLYGKLSGLYLSSLTHHPGSPWDKTWKTYGRNAVIPQSLIQAHYKDVMGKYAAAEADGRRYFPEAL